MSSPCFGRVIWGEFLDMGGGDHRKRRPAVIVTRNDKITPDGEVRVVCITTVFRDSLRDVQTELQPGDRSGLKEQCWAVSSWVRIIKTADIKEYAGTIPGPLMMQILNKMDSLTL